MAEVRQRIEAARAQSANRQAVTLVAVTKTHGPEAVVAAHNAGVLDVGENKVQEAESKMDLVRVPVRWHLIGHLQRNKAKSAIRFDLVHSVDSERLAQAVNDAAQVVNRVQDMLVQVNVSGEGSKSGIGVGDVASFAGMLHQCSHLRVTGVMTMAPFDAPESVLRSVFSGARAVQEQLNSEGHPATVLSMGMSDDFEVAVQEGATLVRLGTVLFGHRASS
ncbi:MAG: YggS family pyridoxal phosphate-dependent enzyme [Gemmatimonadaceae bacterium]